MIELLVVIAIIAILVAIGITAFSSAQQAARNVKRRADVQGLAKAFEQYNLANGGYSRVSGEGYQGCMGMIHDQIGHERESEIAQDPTTNGVYPMACFTTNFCVCAVLEPQGTSTDGNATGVNTSTGACNFASGGGTNFCVSSKL